MPKFRKKSIVIEAVQYVEKGKHVKGICTCYCLPVGEGNAAHVHTIHANQAILLEVGDWVIPEQDGKHYYPCKPDIFEQTYEPV